MKLKNTQPLVTVVMTAFNAARYVDDAIKSIVNQTYPNIRMIIIDDASTDATWKKIRRYSKRYKRVTSYRLKINSGPSEASNFGMAKATGKYIARMDADDIAYPRRIELQVNYMETNPDVVLLGGQCDIIDEQGSTIGEKKFPVSAEELEASLFMMNPISHPACMYRKSVYRKAAIQYEKKYFVSHDLKIIFKLLQYGKVVNIPDTILMYRHRPNSITHQNPKRAFAETAQIRHWALTSGIYQPTITGLAIHMLQIIVVSLLPNALINKLFILWRIKPLDEAKKIMRTALTGVTQLATSALPAFILKPFMTDLK